MTSTRTELPEAVNSLSARESVAIMHIRFIEHTSSKCPVCFYEDQARALGKREGRMDAAIDEIRMKKLGYKARHRKELVP